MERRRKKGNWKRKQSQIFRYSFLHFTSSSSLLFSQIIEHYSTLTILKGHLRLPPTPRARRSHHHYWIDCVYMLLAMSRAFLFYLNTVLFWVDLDEHECHATSGNSSPTQSSIDTTFWGSLECTMPLVESSGETAEEARDTTSSFDHRSGPVVLELFSVHDITFCPLLYEELLGW